MIEKFAITTANHSAWKRPLYENEWIDLTSDINTFPIFQHLKEIEIWITADGIIEFMDEIVPKSPGLESIYMTD